MWDSNNVSSSLEEIKLLQEHTRRCNHMLAQPMLAAGALDNFFSWHDDICRRKLTKHLHEFVESARSKLREEQRQRDLTAEQERNHRKKLSKALHEQLLRAYAQQSHPSAAPPASHEGRG